jgi:hypothetical protein
MGFFRQNNLLTKNIRNALASRQFYQQFKWTAWGNSQIRFLWGAASSWIMVWPPSGSIGGRTLLQELVAEKK